MSHVSARLLIVTLALWASACTTESLPPPEEQQPVPPETSSPPPPAPPTPESPRPDPCEGVAPICSGATTLRYCAAVDGIMEWHDAPCPSGLGCVRGECVSAVCSDECRLGEASAELGTCVLTQLTPYETLPPNDALSLHDRERRYNAERYESNMYFGLVETRYETGALQSVEEHVGMADSALFTGMLLVSDALRLLTTGSADARRAVLDTLDRIHILFNVTGSPGLLARWAAPSGQHPLMQFEERNDSFFRHHEQVPYGGTNYDYEGDISRDQYQGPLLGYSLAYDALGPHDEPARERIRQDSVTLAGELIKERAVEVAAAVRIGDTNISVPVFTGNLRFVVLAPREMPAPNTVEVFLQCEDLATCNAQTMDIQMRGFQEFIPDMSLLVQQITSRLPPWLRFLGDVPIPRAGSAIMLANALRTALQVSESVPGYEADHADIEAFYYGNADEWGNAFDWLRLAAAPKFSQPCFPEYYGNHITMVPLYGAARLETDPVLRELLRTDLMWEQRWPLYADHQNTLFTFMIAAATGKIANADMTIATEQLGQYPPAPRVRHFTDVSTYEDAEGNLLYPPSTECENQSLPQYPVEVQDRPVHCYLWQRHPYNLKYPYGSGDFGRRVCPGVDFSVAYWMGRYHGFIEEDASGTCTVWAPSAP